MAGEWREIPFSQAVQLNPPVQLSRGVTYPFVDMTAVTPGSRSAFASEQREFAGGGSRFAVGDTLMARITPCLENGKIARFAGQPGELAHGSTEFIVIRGRDGVSESDYAYYLTKWEGVSGYAISQMTGTSGRQRVPTEAFDHLEVPLPPLPEQRAIAHILGTLDDKIELNRRMNETLEQMARALFKSWFVDFDPVRAKAAVRRQHPKWTNEQVSTAACPNLNPEIAALFPDSFQDSELGKIPQGWRVGTLGDLVENVIDRIQPSAFTESHPYVPIECIDARTVCLANWQPGSNARSSLIRFRKGDILFGAMRPYFHKVCIAPFDGTTRTTAFVLRPVSTELAYTAFVFSRDDTIEYATAHSEGSTIPYAKWVGSLQAMPIILPMQDVRQAFHRLVWPLIERMMANVSVGTILAAIRDALLPKLISGKIRVKDAERFLKERGLC